MTTNGSGKAKFTLNARLGTVQVEPVKESGYGGPTGGGLVLTLKIERPKIPNAPDVPWQLRHAPDPMPVQEEGEEDKVYKGRLKSWTAQQKGREKDKAAYEAGMEQWRQAMAQMAPRFADFARLAGIAAVMANARMAVTLEPMEDAVLPGFLPLMLGDGQARPTVLEEAPHA